MLKYLNPITEHKDAWNIKNECNIQYKSIKKRINQICLMLLTKPLKGKKTSYI